MGEKASKLSADAESAAANLVERLASLGDVPSATMFGIVDSTGGVFPLGSSSDLQLWGKGAIEVSRAAKKA